MNQLLEMISFPQCALRFFIAPLDFDVEEFEILKFQTPLRQNLEEIRENGGHTKLKLTSQVHDSEGKIR